jgi:serine/threonine-protein kinase
VNRQVAIKMLSSKAAADAEVVARFEREAKLCAQIRHPHVVAVFDCGFEKGVHFLSMEWVDGCSFAGLIEEHGKLTWQDAAAYILQIARAIEHIHGQNIIHRDIKPANILINMQGDAKLADLGLAKSMEADNGMGLTMQGVAMGSPAYMPPEQIRSAKDATPVSDLYALGASFYQAVSGKLPFDGKSATEVMGKVLKDPAPPIASVVPDIPPAIAAFIDRTLTKDPAGRPQDATTFIANLEAAIAAPDVVPKPGKAAGGAASTSRLPLILGAVGVVVILATLAIVLLK